MRWLPFLTLLLLFTSPILGQERARAPSYPLSTVLPEGWQDFPGDPKTPGEVLFLQSPVSGDLDALISFTAHSLPGAWSDIIRRENFLLTVHDNVVLENQPLTLRGAKGHKWIYQNSSADGQAKLYYRLYLSLPATVGPKRLLVMQGTAPLAQTEQAVARFNELARGLTWDRTDQR